MANEDNKLDVGKIDPRIYLGMLVFRWKLIVICFLYALLIGLAYLEFVPKQYLTNVQFVISRDPSTQISGMTYIWAEGQTHIDLLKSRSFNERIQNKLAGQWAKKIGKAEALSLPVDIRRLSTAGIGIEIGVENGNPPYARAYLNAMIEEFRAEREALKSYTSQNASKVLEAELARLEDKIHAAENDVIEFQRLNQFEYVQKKGELELGYLQELLMRQQQLSTEQWMLEVQFPRLKGANAETLRNVLEFTQDTGRVRVPRARRTPGGGDGANLGVDAVTGMGSDAGSAALEEEPETARTPPAERGWQDLRLRLAKMQGERAELAAKLQPDHPELRAHDDAMRAIQKQLDFYTELEFKQIRERYDALAIQVDALEEASRRWKSSYLMASKKSSDLRRLQLVVGRLENMHAALYSKLNDLRVEEEIKGEHFSVVHPVRTDPTPVWPDPLKILMMVLAAGLGAGIGLAVLAHTFDNKVQSISDVEATVGVPFLGGVPYWMHGELSGRARPIVTDENRTGAAEAYRALRTNVLAALEKSGKKMIVVTSADSKEGKTLTVLNLAIMMAKAGKRILLMDMDLRRGVLHKSLETERSPGLTDILREHRPLQDIVQKTPFENLWFAPAGTTEKNTSELLHTADLNGVFQEAMAAYEIVIMDSAPVLRVTDTVILAAHPACAVIYIAHANRTPKQMIRYSMDMLGGAQIIGMIINSIEMNKISSLYYSYQYPNYAYYSYSYAYGYDYYLYDEQGHRKHRSRSQWSWKSVGHRSAQWLRRTFLPVE